MQLLKNVKKNKTYANREQKWNHIKCSDRSQKMLIEARKKVEVKKQETKKRGNG